MSDRAIVRVSAETMKHIRDFAEQKSTENKKVDFGEAADMLIATAVSRKAALAKYQSKGESGAKPRKKAAKQAKPRKKAAKKAKKAKPAEVAPDTAES